MESTRERAVVLAQYIIETGDTVRGAARRYGVSKSTVHADVTRRLRRLDPVLWRACGRVLEHNKEVRHLRGGDATREKYRHLREESGVLCR